jgi:GPH family glycoside/pentoside/hexuronide:cation symporter
MPEVSAVTAVLVVATALCSWRATRGIAFLLPPLPRESFAAAFVVPLRNPAFRPLLLAYVVANLGIGVNAATFFYYYEHVLELSEAATLNVLAVFVLVFTGSILGWISLARKWGKRRPLVVGATVLGIGTTLLYVLVPVGGYAWVMAFGAVGLGSFVGCIVLIDAMLTDVLDHEHLRSGSMRSGAFFGVWRFASKLVRALSVVTVGVVIDLAGFVEQGDVQPQAVDTVLVVLFGPVVGVLFLITAVILWCYRYRDREHARVRHLLARRAERSR